MFCFELTTKKALKWIIILCLLMHPIFLFAAKPVDLRKQNISVLAPFLTPLVTTTADNKIKANTNNLEEISRSVDFNQTLHIRVQQTYKGYKVWGTDSIVHIKKSDSPNQPLIKALSTTSKNVVLNGTIYQDLNADLQNEPSYIFTDAQKNKSLSQVIRLYGQPNKTISNKATQLIIYIDNNKKAHWSYLSSFTADDKTQMPDRMIYIIDATDFHVFQYWNNTQTLFEDVKIGGTGGNERTGKIFYDGLPGHYPVLNIKRDPLQKVCHLRNDKVVLRNIKNGLEDITFNCNEPDKQHNNLYWNEEGFVNGAFSPERDALYAAEITVNMYQQWYNTPVWPDKNGSSKKIMLWMHGNEANADEGGGRIVLGDGDNNFYPFSSLGVVAHEISHGFTAAEQNSKLIYSEQSGGLNESFSDMADKGEFYKSPPNCPIIN